jgi:site-specific DNA recombinase
MASSGHPANRRSCFVKVGAGVPGTPVLMYVWPPPPRHPFSGLLSCGLCGASFVLRNRTCYACASWWNGAACDNGINVPVIVVQNVMLKGIREDLADPIVVEEFERRATAALRQARQPQVDDGRRVAQLEREIANLTDAIAAGGLRRSAALAQRLEAAEEERDRLRVQRGVARIPAAPRAPDVRGWFLDKVANLDRVLELDPERGREELRGILGEKIKLVPDESGRFLWADYSLGLTALVSNAEIMVAGAGFEPATFGL